MNFLRVTTLTITAGLLVACSAGQPILPWTPTPPIVERIESVPAGVMVPGSPGSISLTAVAKDPRNQPLQFLWVSEAVDVSVTSAERPEGTFAPADAATTIWTPPSLQAGRSATYRLSVEASNGTLKKRRSIKVFIDDRGRATVEDQGAS